MGDPITLITGGGDGIGAALARRLASRGRSVLVADVDRAAGEATCRAIGPNAEYVDLDVTDVDAWEALRTDIAARGLVLDALVLNAGVLSGPRGAAVDNESLRWFSREGYDRVTSINLGGTVNGLLTFVPLLRQQQHGQIVIVSSVDALLPYPQDPFYAMTKASQVSLVRSLAPALAADQVRINAICPYAVSTELTPANFRDQPGRGMSPDDFVQAVEELMSGDSTGRVWLKHRADAAAVPYDFAAVEGVGTVY